MYNFPSQVVPKDVKTKEKTQPNMPPLTKLPDEIYLEYIFQYVMELDDFQRLSQVCGRWYNLIWQYNTFLWKLKLIHSNWLYVHGALPSSQSHFFTRVMYEKHVKQQTQQQNSTTNQKCSILEKRLRHVTFCDECQNSGTMIKYHHTQRHSNEIYCNQEETTQSIQKIDKNTAIYFILEKCDDIDVNVLTARTKLINELNYNYVLYWTSNQIEQNQDEKPFQYPLYMKSNGIFFHNCYLESVLYHHVYDKTHSTNNDPQLYFRLYADICALKCLDQTLLQLQKDQQHYHESHTKHSMTWRDPSSSHSTQYALCPVILGHMNEWQPTRHHFDKHQFCQLLGVHTQLYEVDGASICKKMKFSRPYTPHQKHTPNTEHNTVTAQHLHPVDNQNHHHHPIFNPNYESIDFFDVFPENQFSEQFCQILSNWVMKHLKNPHFILLGKNQMNPVPVFIVGLSYYGQYPNVIGFLTASFLIQNHL